MNDIVFILPESLIIQAKNRLQSLTIHVRGTLKLLMFQSKSMLTMEFSQDNVFTSLNQSLIVSYSL